jgi:hypothetical protein
LDAISPKHDRRSVAFAPLAAVAMIVVMLGWATIVVEIVAEAQDPSLWMAILEGSPGTLIGRRASQPDGTTSRTRTRHTVALVGPQDLTAFPKSTT